MKRVAWSMCAFATAVLLLAGVPSGYVRAEDTPPAPAPLPGSVPPIPGIRDRSPLILNRSSVAAFQDVLIAPLAAWMTDGRAVLRVARNVDSPYELAASWYDASEKNPAEYDLTSDFSLSRKSDEPAAAGWPFGSGDEVMREPDPVRRGYKMLWNIEYGLATSGDTLSTVELAWIGTQSKLRSATGLLYSRIFLQPPAPAKPKGTAASLPAATASVPTVRFGQPGDMFRIDGLRLTVPPVVSGFSRFSRSFRDVEEDRLWTFSPVLGRLREELASNRSDGILGSTIAFDDLGVWSGKIQSVKARVVDQKVLLVPFPAGTFYRAEIGAVAEVPRAEVSPADAPAAGKAAESPPSPKGENVLTVRGFQQRSDGTNTMVLWNHETRQFAQFSPWVPTSVVFIPRRVVILELEAQDPYVGIGRSYLFVDQDLQLPIYKLVYDRVGDYRKTVMGGWGLAQSKDGKVRFPFLAFLLVVDQSNQTVSTLTTSQVQTFLTKETSRAAEIRGWFDPDRYPKPKSEERGKAEPKKSPAPAAAGAAGDDETGGSSAEPSKPGADTDPDAESGR